MSTPDASGEGSDSEGKKWNPVTPEPIIIIVESPNPETILDGQDPHELQDHKLDDSLEKLSILHPLLGQSIKIILDSQSLTVEY